MQFPAKTHVHYNHPPLIHDWRYQRLLQCLYHLQHRKEKNISHEQNIPKILTSSAEMTPTMSNTNGQY